MKLLHPLAFVVFLSSCFNAVQVGPLTIPLEGRPAIPTMPFHQLSATDINGQLVKMEAYAGKRVMVVNTASECGFTPQYTQLQELYDAYKDKDFVILGFPCDQFGRQEPGTEADIAAFCTKNYGVTFPMMSKVEVKGDGQHAIYHWLTNKEQNGVMDVTVKWNFHKFLIDEHGRLAMSLESAVSPLDERVLNWLDKK